jgi:hypothetical protein
VPDAFPVTADTNDRSASVCVAPLEALMNEDSGSYAL